MKNIDKQKKFPVGMRVIKTVVASLMCMVIDYFRHEIPFQSVITTTLCIQPDKKDTFQLAVSRLVGTFVGALVGVLVYRVFNSLMNLHLLVYYVVVAFFMIPLIYIDTKLKIPLGVAVSIVIYISITLTNTPIEGVWVYTFNRLLDTLVGVIVAIPVNLFLPQNEPHS